jgi:D-alanyl-lipoteichoic acid acyltransferase DltB (MBOAT superfamily)
VIFLLSGLWHGANWTFVLWGAYHALLFVPLLVMNKNRRYRDTVATIALPDGTIKTKWLPSLKEAGQMLVTFALAVVGWIVFRSKSIFEIGVFFKGIFDSDLFSVPMLNSRYFYLPLFFNICILVVVEWINRTKDHGLDVSRINSRLLRNIIYLFILLLMFISASVEESSFIYFQF